MQFKPSVHDSYRLSEGYSCVLAQSIAHRVKVDFTEFYALRYLFSHIMISNMFHKRDYSLKSPKEWLRHAF